MKWKTYAILSHLPIIGTAVKIITNAPSFYCSLAMEEGLPEVLTEYMRSHPDEIMTCQLAKKLLNK